MTNISLDHNKEPLRVGRTKTRDNFKNRYGRPSSYIFSVAAIGLCANLLYIRFADSREFNNQKILNLMNLKNFEIALDTSKISNEVDVTSISCKYIPQNDISNRVISLVCSAETK